MLTIGSAWGLLLVAFAIVIYTTILIKVIQRDRRQIIGWMVEYPGVVASAYQDLLSGRITIEEFRNIKFPPPKRTPIYASKK